MNYEVILNCVGYCSVWFFVVTYDITSTNRIGADAQINTRDSYFTAIPATSFLLC